MARPKSHVFSIRPTLSPFSATGIPMLIRKPWIDATGTTLVDLQIIP
jgi:hypothetical protein